MSDHDSSDADQLNRRRVLGALASAGAVTLAGCDGTGGTTDTGDGSEPTETIASQTAVDAQSVEARDPNLNWVNKTSFNPVEANLNPQTPNANVPWFIRRIYGDLTVQANLQGTPVSYMAESYEVADDGMSATMRFSDGYAWWDGTPLRAKDVLANRWYTNYTTSYQKTDPNARAEIVQESPPVIEYRFNCRTNPSLSLIDRRFGLVFPKYEFYESVFEEFEDANGSESKINAAAQEFSKETLSMQQIVDRGWGLGLWKPSDWNTQQIVHEKNADHPRAESTNLERFTVELLESNQKITQAISNGEIDAGNVGAISGTSVPNDAMSINHRVPTGAQIGLKLNKANEHLRKPRVRRAIAYVIDHEDILSALENGLGVGAKYPGTQNMTSSQITNNYLKDDVVSEMIDYGKTAKLDEATRLMKDAGYAKEGGIWTDESGNRVELTHVTPTWNKYKFVSNYLKDKLGSFGIQTQVQALSASGLNNRWQNTFEFDVATWFQQGLHPALWYGLGRNGKGWLELRGWALNMLANPDEAQSCEPARLEIKEGKERDDRLKQKIRPEYPATVGTETLDLSDVDETETLEPFVLNDTMRQAQSEDELMDLAAEFASYANWAVPNVELFDEVFTHYGNTEKFVFPSKDTDEYYLRNVWLWAMRGDVDGKSA